MEDNKHQESQEKTISEMHPAISKLLSGLSSEYNSNSTGNVSNRSRRRNGILVLQEDIAQENLNFLSISSTEER